MVLGERPDFEPWDNHCHYLLKGLEDEEGICTTEIVSLFDLAGNTEPFDLIALWVIDEVHENRARLLQQPYLNLQMKDEYQPRKDR